MILSATVWTRSEPCRPCAVAKQLLAEAGIAVVEVKVDEQTLTRDRDFYPKFGKGATFPQVLLDGVHIGGLADLRRALPMWTAGHGAGL